jgi:hypothetical protein
VFSVEDTQVCPGSQDGALGFCGQPLVTGGQKQARKGGCFLSAEGSRVNAWRDLLLHIGSRWATNIRLATTSKPRIS